MIGTIRYIGSNPFCDKQKPWIGLELINGYMQKNVDTKNSKLNLPYTKQKQIHIPNTKYKE